MKRIFALGLTLLMTVLSLTIGIAAQEETSDCIDHNHAMSIDFGFIQEEEPSNSTNATCIHTFAYRSYSSTEHMKVCTKNCGYGVLERHTRSTCYPTTCNSGCGQSLTAAHVYSSNWVYVGDYDTNNNHAKVCTGPYGYYCGYYASSSPCSATGEVWTSTFVINGVHPIYRECGGCGIGIQIGSATHYPSGCIPGCRG